MKFWAFISYSSKDRKWGQWVHRRLENTAIPETYRGKELDDQTTLQKYIRPVFRDRDELAGSSELGPAIAKALRETRTLIVLCSRNSAQSVWVNKEIEDFKALGRDNRILALILDGQPNATVNPDAPDTEECFPRALRLPFEPLAADFRHEGDGKERGFLKILAGVAELDFDDIYRRHERAQKRRRKILASTAMVIIAIMSVLTYYALLQKSNAEMQEGIATRSGQKAVEERNKARRTLANLFYEKAAQNRDKPNVALAWAQRAVQTDGTLIESPDLQGQISQWIGPWPGPDFVIGNGILDQDKDVETVLQPESKRLLILTTDQAWSLLSWDGKVQIAKGTLDDRIESRFSMADKLHFVLSGRYTVEVRSWETGDLVARFKKGGGFSIKSVSNVESGLILCADIRTSNPRRTIHHGAIYTWNPLTEDLPKKIGADLPGQLMESVVKETADQLALLLRFKRGDETALLAFQLSFDLKTLKPRSLASPFAKEKVSIRNHLAPQIDVNFCSVFFDGHRDSRFVYDFSTGRFYELQLEDKEQLAAYVRVEKRPQALIWRRDDDRQTGSCYLHDLTAEKPKQTIFEAHKLKMVIFMDESKQFVAWDENEQMIGVRELNGLERWIPIPMPLGHKQRTYEINVHDQNHIVLVDHDSQVTLIDLRPEMAFPVHVFQTSDFQRFLAIEDLPGGAIKTTVLSHHGSAFSHFKNLKPEAKRLEASSTKSWSVQNLPIWSLIDTDGVDLTLAINKDTESARLRRSVGKVAVIPPVTVGRAGNDPQDAIIEAVDSFVHYGTYEDKRIIDVKSSLHWQIPDGQKGLHLVKHKDRVAFLTNIGDSLVLTQLPTKEFLWKIDIKDKMESNEITTVVSDSKHIYLCELSPPSVFEPKRDFARIRLTRQAVSTGEILDQWIWNTSEEEAKRLSSSWGRKLHIILSPNPSVILDTATDDGMRVLLNTNEGKLVEQLRWLGGREPLHILNGNESFTVDLSTSDTQKKMLGIFRFKGDKWERQEIALSAPLKKFYPAPNGKRALIATERGLQLWDLESNQAIGTTLEGPNIFLQGSAPNVVWSPPGDSLFIWDDWRINQYDTESGKYLQTHKEHTRDDTQFRTENPPKICLVTLSPDGKWLVSGDAQGTMIRSNLSPRNISAKALRAAALAIGGMEVTEDGQLQNWQPTR